LFPFTACKKGKWSYFPSRTNLTADFFIHVGVPKSKSNKIETQFARLQMMFPPSCHFQVCSCCMHIVYCKDFAKFCRMDAATLLSTDWLKWVPKVCFGNPHEANLYHPEQQYHLWVCLLVAVNLSTFGD